MGKGLPYVSFTIQTLVTNWPNYVLFPYCAASVWKNTVSDISLGDSVCKRDSSFPLTNKRRTFSVTLTTGIHIGMKNSLKGFRIKPVQAFLKKEKKKSQQIKIWHE